MLENFEENEKNGFNKTSIWQKLQLQINNNLSKVTKMNKVMKILRLSLTNLQVLQENSLLIINY